MNVSKTFRVHQEQTIQENKIQQYFSDPYTIRSCSIKDQMTFCPLLLTIELDYFIIKM